MGKPSGKSEFEGLIPPKKSRREMRVRGGGFPKKMGIKRRFRDPCWRNEGDKENFRGFPSISEEGKNGFRELFP